MSKSNSAAKETVADKIEKSTRLKVGFIGIGNAGNQMAISVNSIEEVDTFAINSSLKDIEHAINAGVNHFIMGEEARGAGKNRETAKSLYRSNGRILMTDSIKFNRLVRDSDIVFVSGAMGGGTGSGAAPELINGLKKLNPTKIFIFIGVLPRIAEAVNTQANSLSCFKEIKDLDIPYILIDLEKLAHMKSADAYKVVGDMAISIVTTIIGLKCEATSGDAIDENDMRTLMNSPGYMSIYTVNGLTQDEIDEKCIGDRMVESIKETPLAEIIRDGVIANLGVIVNAPDEFDDDFMRCDYGKMTTYTGKPDGVFENQGTVGTDKGASVAVILSGQSSPHTRIKKMTEIVEEGRVRREKAASKEYELGIELEQNEIPDFLKDGDMSDEAKNDVLDDLFG